MHLCALLAGGARAVSALHVKLLAGVALSLVPKSCETHTTGNIFLQEFRIQFSYPVAQPY